jgi:hypothetical protein
MMPESPETQIAVLRVQLAGMERTAEERMKLADARHAELIAEMKALRAELSSAGKDDEFRRGQAAGVAGTVKAAWAIVGVFGGAAVTWLMSRGT